jgi:DNA-binding MarR family transcriptional regulator
MAVDPAATPRSLKLVGSTDAKRPPRRRGGAADPPRIELQRARKLVTAAEAVRQFPFAGLSDGGVNGRAAISRETLEANLQGREACLLAAFESVLALAAERATAAFQAQDGWLDRVRAGLLAVLEFFDQQPALARFLLVHSAQAGPPVLAARREALDRLARVLDDEHAPARGYPPPLTAQALVSGVLGVLHQRLSGPDSGVLVALTGPLMSFIVLPFLGPKVARSELRGPVETTSALAHALSFDLLQDPGGAVDQHRTVLVLRVLAAEPDLSNREVALRMGVKNEPDMSRTLVRTARLGLIENTRERGAHANAWRLTSSGAEHEAAITRDAAAAASMAVEVPEEFGGRMDHRLVAVVRVIADQPWLHSSELAARAGVEDLAALSTLLAHLAKLGLVAGVRDVHFRGTPNAWRLTPSGERLDRAIARESPAPPRSVALDLMWESGGRLSDDAISLLRVLGPEPGLSNREIAVRLGITDENSSSQLLARVARRGLIENTRTGGRYNVWRLTVVGEKLEGAIRQETPEPVARRIALDLLKSRGGRLNHRAVWALRAIGAEPGLNNEQIALQVGIKGRGDISSLLARLARFGLIESAGGGGRAHVWRLTATGRELDRASGREIPAPKRSRSQDLMEESGGPLSDRAVDVLRVIGAEPGLSNGGVALRLGTKDESRVSQVLAPMRRRGLIENTRTGGRENIWQLSATGEELERAIWQETSAAAQRKLALDLLRDPGGRLNGRAVSVLRLIGAEDGLSDGELARRVGARDQSRMSRLLARLARFELIEHTRSGRRKNVWQLTASGRELDRMISEQTPEPKLSVALDLMQDSGGRLSDRAVAALSVIGAEPGLSNGEVGQRVGVKDPDASHPLLAGLARRGLIENALKAPAPFVANIWQLTAAGKELDAAIRDENQDASP